MFCKYTQKNALNKYKLHNCLTITHHFILFFKIRESFKFGALEISFPCLIITKRTIVYFAYTFLWDVFINLSRPYTFSTEHLRW